MSEKLDKWAELFRKQASDKGIKLEMISDKLADSRANPQPPAPKKRETWWQRILKHVFAYYRAYEFDWEDGTPPVTYQSRYNGMDANMQRPVHRYMSVAPPGAKMIYIEPIDKTIINHHVTGYNWHDKRK